LMGSGRVVRRGHEREAGKEQVVEKANLERFRRLLLEERKRVLEELDYMEKNYVGKTPRDASSSSAYSMHPADMGTDSSEMEKAYLIGSAGGSALEDIDDALRKIDKGEYGCCEGCGEEIGRERLEAVPYARHCIRCRTDLEKSGGPARDRPDRREIGPTDPEKPGGTA